MRTTAATVLTVACSWLFLAAPSPAQAEELVIIVNAANPNAALSLAQAKSYFMKKTAPGRTARRCARAIAKATAPSAGRFSQRSSASPPTS